MTQLYIRDGADPQPLPFQAYDANNRLWTDLPDNEEGRAAAGWDRIAPSRPADTEEQTAEWDAEAQAWIMVDRPPMPTPEPDPYANFVPVPLMRQRVEKLGMLDPFAAYLAQRPPLLIKVMSLERGVDPAYPEIAAAFEEMDIPQAARDYILAPPSAGVADPPAMG